MPVHNNIIDKYPAYSNQFKVNLNETYLYQINHNPVNNIKRILILQDYEIRIVIYNKTTNSVIKDEVMKINNMTESDLIKFLNLDENNTKIKYKKLDDDTLYHIDNNSQNQSLTIYQKLRMDNFYLIYIETTN